MKISRLIEIVEMQTGAIFLNPFSIDPKPEMTPLSVPGMEKANMNEVDKFWCRFFATEAHFDQDGELTEESRLNILSHLEAIQAQARGLALDILYGVDTMPPLIVKEAVLNDERRSNGKG